MSKPFKKFDDVFVTYSVPGNPYVIGERVMIVSVSNMGTKRSPEYRYYVAGAWFDHDALSMENPLG